MDASDRDSWLHVCCIEEEKPLLAWAGEGSYRIMIDSKIYMVTSVKSKQNVGLNFEKCYCE